VSAAAARMTSTSEISRLRIIDASSAAEASSALFRPSPLMGEGEGGGDTSYRRDRLSCRESRERSSCKRVRSHSAGFWNSDIMADHDSVDYEARRGCTTPTQPSPIEGEGSVNASRRNPVSTEAAEKIEAETTLRRQLAYVMISD